MPRRNGVSFRFDNSISLPAAQSCSTILLIAYVRIFASGPSPTVMGRYGGGISGGATIHWAEPNVALRGSTASVAA
jgi:hypothetical protein